MEQKTTRHRDYICQIFKASAIFSSRTTNTYIRNELDYIIRTNKRDALAKYLKKGIATGIHYIPLLSSATHSNI